MPTKDKITKYSELLYQRLPAIYREKDNHDLDNYLAVCGGLLDALRNTLEQRLADAFIDEPVGGQCSQDWLTPYFAQLFDVKLAATEPAVQRQEVANAIMWRQRKGSLVNVTDIIKKLMGSDCVIHEGWQHVAMTPNMNSVNLLRGQLPITTVHTGYASRALAASDDDVTAHSVNDTYRYHYHYPYGVPCQTNSYDDVSRRSVDMRTLTPKQGHYHPKHIVIYSASPTESSRSDNDYLAKVAITLRKLKDFLPVGMEAVIVIDLRLYRALSHDVHAGRDEITD